MDNEINREDLFAACIEAIISMTDDEFALLKTFWERRKETQEDQSA